METARTDPMLGATVGRYRLDRVIGAGGMGRVYLGVQPAIGARVAIKILAADVVADADLVARFFTEARAANVIHHDNIVRVLDLDRLPDGRPYIVMEHVDGVTLRELLARGPMPIGGVIAAINEVLLALHAAHKAGIVHRDLKPDNVMITATGHAKVLDFGIAKLSHPVAPRTVTGVAVGTPYYMAPEQISGEPVDARTDVYAAGCVLFELLTGTRPFDGPTDYEVMTAHVSAPPPSLRALRAGLPDALDHVIRQALAKRPGDRFATAKAMAHALAQVQPVLPDAERRPLVGTAHWLPHDPAATAPTPPPVAPSVATVVGSGKARGGAPTRAKPSRRGWRIGVALGVAAVATAAIVIATRGGGGGDGDSVDRPAAPAVAAASTPAPPDAARAGAFVATVRVGGGDTATMTVGGDGTVTVTVPPQPAPEPEPPGPAKPGKAKHVVDGGTTAPDTAKADPVANAPEYEERSATRMAKKPDYNPKRLDVLAYATKAEAFVHDLSPKARITAIRAGPIGASGRVDLTSVDRAYAKYEFVSPVAPCTLSVTLNEAHSVSWIDDNTEHCGKARGMPSCTLAQVYARAVADESIYKDELVDIEWTGTEWEILPDEAGIVHLDDDCSHAITGTPRDAPVEKTESADFDPDKRTFEQPFKSLAGLDVKAYAATARGLARKLEPDAELTEISTWATADGTVTDGPAYYYRSAKAIASPDPDRLNCIGVDIQPWGKKIVRVQRAARACERDRAIHAPRCTVAAVMAKLAQPPSKAANVMLDDRGWRVMGGGVDETVADDCQ